MGGNHIKKNLEFATTKCRLCHTDLKTAIFPLSRAIGTKPPMKVVKRFSPCHVPAVGFKEDIFYHSIHTPKLEILVAQKALHTPALTY